MKKCLVLIFSCICCCDCFATSAVVRYIVDGDTFIADILMNNAIRVNSVSVRLRNVDTPEIHGNCDYEIKRANIAKQRLAELIPVESTVEIDNVTDDKYPGRIDANVFDANGKDVGLILIKEKLGRPYSGGKRLSWCD